MSDIDTLKEFYKQYYSTQRDFKQKDFVLYQESDWTTAKPITKIYVLLSGVQKIGDEWGFIAATVEDGVTRISEIYHYRIIGLYNEKVT